MGRVSAHRMGLRLRYVEVIKGLSGCARKSEQDHTRLWT
jgi:hypothetical protein